MSAINMTNNQNTTKLSRLPIKTKAGAGSQQVLPVATGLPTTGLSTTPWRVSQAELKTTRQLGDCQMRHMSVIRNIDQTAASNIMWTLDNFLGLRLVQT